MGRETNITNNIFSYLKRRPRCKAIKIHGSIYQEKGTPDIFCVDDGIPYILEAKVPGKAPTDIQKKRLQEWYGAGAITAVVENVDDVKNILKNWDLISDWKDRIDGM